MKIVFDIGGTSTRVARIEGTTVAELHKFPTPQDPSRAVVNLAEAARALGAEPVEAAAGCIAGVIKAGVVLRSPNLKQWDGFNFAERLSEALGARASIGNDAAVAALGEARFGAGKGAAILAYVCVGTGVGGARVVGGRLDAFTHGFEPGQMIMETEKGATLESLVSGGALKRLFNTFPGKIPAGEYLRRVDILAAGLHNCLTLWSPDRLIMGGGAINDADGYKLADIKAALKKIPNIFPSLPDISRSELGEYVGLYGALALLD